jgi:TrmH family RNA methyltransferase
MEHLSKNKIKWIRSLRLKKNRDNEGLFIAEGPKIVGELIDRYFESIECICTTDNTFKSEVETYLTDEKTMKELSSLNTPSAILAVVKKPTMNAVSPGLTLAIDGIQDPGNMGTIIRTADWFGVESIVCSKETVDVFNPKVIQSTMGSIFRVPITHQPLDAFFEKNNYPVYGALLNGKNMYDQKIQQPCVLLMGNEGNGISPELQPYISHPVLIPGKGEAESLNVAIATGILLAELSKH